LRVIIQFPGNPFNKLSSILCGAIGSAFGC
jgi:hypothetical protein